MTYASGLGVIAVFAYFVPHWSQLSIFCGCFSGILVTSSAFVLPESPMWLNSKNISDNRYVRSRKILDRFRSETEIEELESLKNGKSSEMCDSEISMGLVNQSAQIFNSKMLLKRVFFCTVCWSVISLMYFGFNMNMGAIVKGSIYSNMCILWIIESIGGVVVPVLIMSKLGRIKYSIVVMSVVGVSSWSCFWLDAENMSDSRESLGNISRWIGKLAISSIWTSLYVHTPELFPTQLRLTGFGMPDGISRFVTSLSPFFGVLYKSSKSVFWLVHVGMALVAIFSYLCLPETENIYPDSKNDCRAQDKTVILSCCKN